MEIYIPYCKWANGSWADERLRVGTGGTGSRQWQRCRSAYSVGSLEKQFRHWKDGKERLMGIMRGGWWRGDARDLAAHNVLVSLGGVYNVGRGGGLGAQKVALNSGRQAWLGGQESRGVRSKWVLYPNPAFAACLSLLCSRGCLCPCLLWQSVRWCVTR